MTTHGIDRLRASLDNQRSAGAMTYAMALEDMEVLVREVETERRLTAYAHSLAEPPATASVVEVDTADEWEDSADFTPRAVFADADRAEAYAAALRSNGERVWVVKGLAVDPEAPDSWAAVTADATISPVSYCHARGIDRDVDWEDMSEGYEAMALDLVARCKKLAGVE